MVLSCSIPSVTGHFWFTEAGCPADKADLGLLIVLPPPPTCWQSLLQSLSFKQFLLTLYFMFCLLYKIHSLESGEIAQWLRALVALTEDLSSVLSTPMAIIPVLID